MINTAMINTTMINAAMINAAIINTNILKHILPPTYKLTFLRHWYRLSEIARLAEESENAFDGDLLGHGLLLFKFEERAVDAEHFEELIFNHSPVGPVTAQRTLRSERTLKWDFMNQFFNIWSFIELIFVAANNVCHLEQVSNRILFSA